MSVMELRVVFQQAIQPVTRALNYVQLKIGNRKEKTLNQRMNNKFNFTEAKKVGRGYNWRY